jgi:E3 ubiquitin-protein ligase DMA1/2
VTRGTFGFSLTLSLVLASCEAATPQMQMLSNLAPSPPPASPNLGPVTPQGPSRRLRGLSYLRSYTQQHLSSSNSRSPHHTLSQSVSYPVGDTTTTSPTNQGPENGRLEPNGEAVANSSPTSLAIPAPHNQPAAGGLGETLRPPDSLRARSASPAVGTSIPSPNNESRDKNRMARRRAHSSRSSRTPAIPEPTYSTDAMRFARLDDGPPHLDPNPSDIPPQVMSEANSTAEANTTALFREPSQSKLPSITFLPHQDPRSTRPSLSFAPVTRTLKSEASVIRVGRYSERETFIHSGPHEIDAAPVGFKSKVVSRKHCEFWFSNGKWWIKDVRSSSGTFLNHIRLSPANQESRPYQVNDGDVIQLGIDFRGGEEQIFRCVKIKVESNRSWQKKLNNFKYAFTSSIQKGYTDSLIVSLLTRSFGPWENPNQRRKTDRQARALNAPSA